MSKLIPLTQGKFAMVDDEDYEKVMRYKWYFNRVKNTQEGYAVSSARDSNGKKVLMHRILVECEGVPIDHVSGNKLDNRKSNLRAVDSSINNRNVDSRPNSTSKYVGVSWDKVSKKWKAQITLNGKVRNLGRFMSELDAHKARQFYIVSNNLPGYRRY